MRSSTVTGVLSGCGGAGASVFAAVLAGVAAARFGHAFLIDCDPLGGGIDVLLGCEQLPGPRWGQVRLRGGTLEASALRDGLPRWQDVSFLAADSAAPLEAIELGRVIDTAAGLSPVVLDLSRLACPARTAALARCAQVLLLTPAEVRGVTASALVAAQLPVEHTGVLVRGVSRTLPAAHIGSLLGLPVLGELPYDPAGLHPAGLELRRVRRATRRVAERLVASADPSGVVVAEPDVPTVAA